RHAPHPSSLTWYASTRLEDAADVAAILHHVPIVWSPVPKTALAGVAQDELGGALRGLFHHGNRCCWHLSCLRDRTARATAHIFVHSRRHPLDPHPAQEGRFQCRGRWK